MALRLLQGILSSDNPLVAIDTETNGEDVRDGRGVCYGVSICDGNVAMYLPFRHRMLSEENLDFYQFRHLLQQIIDNKTVLYFNAKFDIVSLGTLGLKTRRKQFRDTMVLSHLVNENMPQRKSLDRCAKYYLGNEGKKASPEYLYAVNTFGYANMSASLTSEYAMTDAVLTWDLYHKLAPLLNAENLGAMWQHKMEFIELLIDMESRGVLINQDLCRDMAERGHREMDRIRWELNGLNPGSPTDLQALLIDSELNLPVVKLTPKGKPCFDKYAMEDYDLMLARLENPLAKKVFAYRGWQKSTSSNYEPYLSLLSPDGRLRPNYNMHRVRTGRLSCEKPNLQQIPRAGEKPWNGKMKQCFIAQPGYVLIEGDYSQLEFRLGAAFAKEQKLLDAFADRERDVFTEMSKLLGMPRYDCKTLEYSLSYGAGIRRIMAAFGVSAARAKEIRDSHYATYPNLKRASNYASNYVLAKKKIPIWSGRYRHFLDPKKENHKAFNSLCQGGAADIVERTMLRCHNAGLNNDDCRMLLQVHDSIVWEVREDLVEQYRPRLISVMEDVTPSFNVPFHVDLHAWAA